MSEETKERLSKFEYEEAIKTYKYVRDGVQRSYPLGFFSEKGVLKLKAIMEHYFYEENNFTEDEAIEIFTNATLGELGLIGALRSVFNKESNRRVKLFEVLFPDKPVWRINIIPKEIWNDETKKDFCIWFLEEHNNFTKETILDEIDTEEILRNIDSIAIRPFRKFTGISDVISTAYDMDREQVKSALKSKTTTKTMQRYYGKDNLQEKVVEPEKPQEELTCTQKTLKGEGHYSHLYMMYYTCKDNALECYMIGGNSKEEISEKADETAKSFGAVKYWLEQIG